MKKQILTAIAVMASLCGYAQTKGTSALGFGVNVSTNKSESNSLTGVDQENKTRNFSLGYGFFVKDNAKLGIELNYGNTDNSYAGGSQTESKSYGANVTYQQYYPLIKTLYAYAGGRAGYGQTKQESFDEPTSNNVKGSQYTAGVYGGITWFISKRFAFETSLLSANASYSTYEQKISNAVVYENKQTNFNLSSDGFINNLGFKIYLLF
ncbi:outer membrane beta-barrel protein [Pedobacter heparinus]|uniref:outer membrane beta-barrel protein n=1 Tax=Pedobacter heparinus TaxID=984 RepID=UPI002930FDBC|nr:outer membrane beta-barrel protein [Pedobacter heparinus]